MNIAQRISTGSRHKGELPREPLRSCEAPAASLPEHPIRYAAVRSLDLHVAYVLEPPAPQREQDLPVIP